MEDVADDAADEHSGDEPAPERGSMNDDGSINLGLRRRFEHSPTVESQSGMHTNRIMSPLPSLPTLPPASDLAHYHQSNITRITPGSFNDGNRLAPLTSIAAASAERQTSASPASFAPHRRKRSFSAAEGEVAPSGDPAGQDNTKRISSIKSILNPSTMAHSPTNTATYSDDGDYSLPPIRSPGSTVASAPSPHAYASFDSTTGTLSAPSMETDRLKNERRAALQREAEKMREMLAAKERELQALGQD